MRTQIKKYYDNCWGGIIGPKQKEVIDNLQLPGIRLEDRPGRDHLLLVVGGAEGNSPELFIPLNPRGGGNCNQGTSYQPGGPEIVRVINIKKAGGIREGLGLSKQNPLEPCICGSGRPKNECCQNSPGRILSFTDIKFSREIKKIQEELYEFLLQDPEGLERAFSRSVFGDFMEYSELIGDQDYFELFLDWLAFDYPDQQGEVPFSRFLHKKKDRIRGPLYGELMSWKNSFRSAYRVQELIPGQGLILQDIFSRSWQWLAHRELNDLVGPGDIIIARLLRAGNWKVCFLEPMFFPQVVEEPLAQDITAMQKRMVNWGYSFKSWSSFLRQHEEILLSILCASFSTAEPSPEERDQLWEREAAVKIRNFLRHPRPELEFQSPREISLDPLEVEKKQDFYSRLDRGFYDRPEMIFSGFKEEILSLLGEGPDPRPDLAWGQEEYFAEACFLARRMARCHFPLDIEKALTIWQQFSANYQPSLRKKGSWAAVVDYFFSQTLGYPETQAQVARVYGVSAASISRKIGPFSEFAVLEGKQGGDGDLTDLFLFLGDF